MIMGITLTHLELLTLKYFRSFRGTLLLKPVTGQELLFAVSYSKPALATLQYCPIFSKPLFLISTNFDSFFLHESCGHFLATYVFEAFLQAQKVSRHKLHTFYEFTLIEGSIFINIDLNAHLKVTIRPKYKKLGRSLCCTAYCFFFAKISKQAFRCNKKKWK